ncbi:MAG: ATP12 family protein [Hyphomonadaceae bacterium]
MSVKRAYANAAAQPVSGGYAVLLDARTLATPAQKPFVAPTAALAEAVAAEWNAQGERIAPATMPLTRLCFAAIARSGARDDLIAHVARYAETDLVSHRAEGPAALAARQAAAWDPLIAWMKAAMDVALPVTASITAGALAAPCRARVLAAAGALDDFKLTALAQGAGLSGSAAIGFALLAGRIGAEEAFAAAELDALFSLETWGEDEEARFRLERIRQEFAELAQFLALLG